MCSENRFKQQSDLLNSGLKLTSRRGFLGRTMGLIYLGAAPGLFSVAVPASALAAPTQANWRRCQKCNMLFFDGYRDKGRCPAGGGHAVFGRFDYVLVYDDSTGPGQGDWRFCRKCKSLFFNGYAAKGGCAAGAAHEAAGFNFFLFHDRRPAGNEVENWRFCNKCFALFYNNAPATSVCPKGDSHVAQGFKFVMRIQGGNLD